MNLVETLNTYPAYKVLICTGNHKFKREIWDNFTEIEIPKHNTDTWPSNKLLFTELDIPSMAVCGVNGG